MIAIPIEIRPGIGLAAGRDMLVSTDRTKRMRLLQCNGQGTEQEVLRIGKRLVIGAFELDSDREIVALRSFLETRDAGMPGPLEGRDKLVQRAIAPHQKMG